MGIAIEEPLPDGYEQELSKLAKVTDTGDDSGLSKLPLNIAHYESLRNKMLDIPVPVALKNAHLAILNSLSAMWLSFFMKRLMPI